MSDVSQGTGWWLASDGKWYPPEQYVHPPPPKVAADDGDDELEDAWEDSPDSMFPDDPPDLVRREDGYWLADDGRWYPPDVPAVPSTYDDQYGAPRISGMAIASLVLGLVPVVPFVGSILAIVFGAVARSQIREAAGRLRGAAMAAWGIALGILSIVGTVVVIAVVVHAHGQNAPANIGVSAPTTLSDYQYGYQEGESLPGTTAAQACSQVYVPAVYAGCIAGWNAANG